MRNLPTNRIPKIIPTHCLQCKDKLDKDNISKREGVTNKRCRVCLSKNVAKYNAKRKKALAGGKWF